jgi:hypothetical protein
MSKRPPTTFDSPQSRKGCAQQIAFLLFDRQLDGVEFGARLVELLVNVRNLLVRQCGMKRDAFKII